MVAQLRAGGIVVTVDPENYPYGRFARTHDPDGNPIELWLLLEDADTSLNRWVSATSPCGMSQMCAIALYSTGNGGVLRVKSLAEAYLAPSSAPGAVL
jgi:hypothetical protein